MTNKTLNQITEMKKQTIGVEVEMNNITRDKRLSLQPNTSEQDDMKTPQAETDTVLGRLGTSKVENGNSKRT